MANDTPAVTALPPAILEALKKLAHGWEHGTACPADVTGVMDDCACDDWWEGYNNGTSDAVRALADALEDALGIDITAELHGSRAFPETPATANAAAPSHPE